MAITFNPVVKKAERFPYKAVVTLLSKKSVKDNVETISKAGQIELSSMAIEQLGLKDENARFAVTLGYLDEAKEQIGLFVYSTNSEKFKVLNTKTNNENTYSASKVHATNRRLSNNDVRALMASFSTVEDKNDEINFVIKDHAEADGTMYFLLEEFIVEKEEDKKA